MKPRINIDKIKEFFIKLFDFVKRNFKNVLIVVLLLLLGIYMLSNNHLKRNLSDTKTDLAKAKNEMVINKNKADELYASTQGFIITINGLKKENKDIYNEVKKYKSNPIVITKVVTKTEIDTITLTNNVIKNGNKIKTNWSYDKEYSDSASISILGYTALTLDSTLNVTYSKSELTKFLLNSKMYVGLAEKNGKIEIYARPSNPLISVSSLDGYLVDPQKSEVLKKVYKPNKLSLGINVGYGLSLGNTKLVPYIGIGLNYRLIQF